MNFFISPPAKTDWRLSPEELRAALAHDFPVIDLQAVQNPQSLHALTWSTESNGRRLDGSLTKEGDTVRLDGEVRDCAKFALWLRARTPEQHPLLFYDEGFSADVPLLRDTTEDELVKPFLKSGMR